MAGYGYLHEGLKRDIQQQIDSIFEALDLRTPPVNYGTLYEGEKLIKRVLSIREINSLGLKDVGQIQEELRGLLLVNEKHVFVIDQGKYLKRINFVLGHEFGHWKLPWHRELLYKCNQYDLSTAARKQLEIEANFFASEFSFMRDLFFETLESSELSLSNIKLLSDLFEMSIESTFRRSAEIEIRPCALLSLIVNTTSERDFLKIRYVVHSESFKTQIGTISHRQTFPQNHRLSEVITDPIKSAIGEFECDEILLGKKKIPLRAEVWKNRWNIFVLFQPKTP